MVASVIHHLGLYMGDEFHEEKGYVAFEDNELHEAATLQRLRKLIHKRNQNYRVWGWKYPELLYAVELIHSEFINPHFVAVYRDPYAVALCDNRKYGMDIEKSLTTAVMHYMLQDRIFLRFSDLGYPIFRVSYEKAMQQRRKFVTELAEFVGIDPTRGDRIENGLRGIK